MSVESQGILLGQQQVRAYARYAWVWRDVVLPLLLTRLVLTAVGFLAINTMPLDTSVKLSHTGVRHAWASTWGRWDAVWYLRIVRDGYFYHPGEQSSVAFPPLYPALMKAGGYVLGQNDHGWLLSGILVANLLLLVAMVYLWKLVRLDFAEHVARRAVFYALIAPTTLFLSAAYPMSLILAIAVASFYYARKGQWWTAAGIAALAPLARPDGCLLVPGLVVEYLRQHEFRWRAIRADIIPLIALPACALGAWMMYLQVRFGDALAFLHVQKAWAPTPMWSNLRDFDILLGIMAGISCGLLLLAGWLTLRSSYMVYASLQWLLIMSAGRAMSVPRFVLVLFPIYIILAMAGRHAQFDRLWTIVSMAFAAVFLLRFSLCYFIG